jgi:hypothetical protein
MKRLLTFDQLNELSNWSLVRSYLDKMWNEIIELDNYCKREMFHNYNYSLLEFSYPIKFENKIEKILSKYIKELETIDIHSVYTFTKFFEPGMSYCYFTIKNKYTKRVRPNKYVYHCSSIENRESILKNGLIPKKHSDSKNYKNDKSFSYPAAIFATNTGVDNVWRKNTSDVWKIDTENLSNKWRYDLNLYTNNFTREIMTYDPIPPEHLELVKKVSEKPSLSFAEINNL